MPYQNNKHNYVQIMFFLQVEYTKVIYLALKISMVINSE